MRIVTKNPVLRLLLALASGLATGWYWWHELNTAPRGALWKRLPLAISQAIYGSLNVGGVQFHMVWEQPVPGRRGRIAQAYTAVMSLQLIAVVLAVVLPTRAERAQRLRDWEEQKERYGRFAQEWRQRRGRSSPHPWRRLVRPSASERPAPQRGLFVVLTVAIGVAHAITTWQEPPARSFSMMVVTPLRVLGILPSRYWVPRPLRLAGLLACVPFLGLGAMFFGWLGIASFRQALASDAERQREYEELRARRERLVKWILTWKRTVGDQFRSP
jgi:hypothetical protein